MSKIRKTVFGSESERRLYRSLHQKWNQQYNIYHNLPLAQILSIDSIDVREKEKDFLLKTSVDYTLCDKEDKPLMSIEFDGLGEGYSRDNQYIQKKPTDDKFRQLKLDCKLRACHESDYPLLIISFDELNIFDDNLQLKIVDGIIGQFTHKIAFQEKINQHAEENSGLIDSLQGDDRHEYVQDLVISTEVESELEHDPLAKLACEIQGKATELGLIKNWSEHFVNRPELPDIKSIFDFEGLQKRITAFKNVEWVGKKIVVKTTDIPVIATAWVRNFESAGINPSSISGHLAEIKAFGKVIELFEKGIIK